MRKKVRRTNEIQKRVKTVVNYDMQVNSRGQQTANICEPHS